MDDYYNKHYIRVDERNCIVNGFSNAFEQPQDGDILHNERGGRHFQLRIKTDDGGILSKENPPLYDVYGVPLYTLIDDMAQQRTPEELDADRPPLPEPGPDILSIAARSLEVAALSFVALAQTSELFDDVTILENADMFAEWPIETGLEVKRGTILWDDGALYRALHDIGASHKAMRPSENYVGKGGSSANLWQKIGNPDEEWKEWSQWIGVGDLYQIGAKVRSIDFGNAADTTVYRWISTAADNVWKPGEFGWEKAGVYEE